MSFNLQKFLIENRLTKRSRLNEDAETKTDAELEAMGAGEGDSIAGEEEMFDDGGSDFEYKDDEIGSSDEFEKEPPAQDAGAEDSSLSDIQKKQSELNALENEKDVLLMQLKSGQLNLDQYKTAIGNLPTKIKKLRADIKKVAEPAISDTEDDEDLV